MYVHLLQSAVLPDRRYLQEHPPPWQEFLSARCRQRVHVIDKVHASNKPLKVTCMFHLRRRMGGSRSPIRVGADVLPGSTWVLLVLSVMLLVLLFCV